MPNCQKECAIIRGRLVTRSLFAVFALVMMYSLFGCSHSGSAMVPAATLRSTATNRYAPSKQPDASDSWGGDQRETSRDASNRGEATRMEIARNDDRDGRADDRANKLPSRARSGVMSTVSLRDGLEPRVPSRDWQHIVLHHSGTTQGDIESIDAEHRQRRDALGAPWLGIGYHFVIGNGQGMPDGLIEPTFRWRQQLHGAHAAVRSFNERGIGICLIGDFTQTAPTPKQIAATRQLLDDLSERYKIAPERILRHSEIVATECPGDKFPLDQVVRGNARTAVSSSPPATRHP